MGSRYRFWALGVIAVLLSNAAGCSDSAGADCLRPPIWTGEKVRGEGANSGNGAVSLFASDQPDSLMIVDAAFAEGITGRRMLRTAWMDSKMLSETGVCPECSPHWIIQFDEPQLVYTVTEMPQIQTIYQFTEALMQHLPDTPLGD